MSFFPVTNKAMIITGAANGLGAALARALFASGAHLILVDIDNQRLGALVKGLQGTGRVLSEHVLDLTLPQQREELKYLLDAENIKPVGLFNCVGSTYSKPFHEASRQEIDHILSLNIHAMVDLCHLFIPGMLEQREGYILNMSSTSAFIPCPDMVCYSASKAFINNFSQTLGIELSSKNIHVRYACPGAVETDFFATAGMDRLDYVRKVRKMHPDYVAQQCLDLFQGTAPGKVIGVKNKINMLIARVLPTPILQWVVARRFR